jgi:hypothetical protein
MSGLEESRIPLPIYRLIPAALILIGLTFAQSQPCQEQETTTDASASDKILQIVKNLQERVAMLEQELVEVRLQRAQRANEANAASVAGPETAAGARRPQVEDEEPFDAAKMRASDEAEVEAVAKAVSLLLPDNVRRATEEPVRASESGRIASATRVTVQAGGPKPVRRVDPAIPGSMRNSIAGEVTVSVKVYVGANGEVIGTIPVRQGDPTADQIGVLAAEAVNRWRFEPVQQNGLPVPSQTMVQFRFAKTSKASARE